MILPLFADNAPVNLLIRRAQLISGELVDLRIAGGVISELGDQLSAAPGEGYIDMVGNLLLPGLQDHHLHLYATAAAQNSLACGPPEVNTSSDLEKALVEWPAEGDEWIRGTGFHDSVCPGLDRHWLDRVCPTRPVRIQHRSGGLWILNSYALAQLKIGENAALPAGAERDASGQLSGRFYHLDDWLGERLPRSRPSLVTLSRQLASYGITAVTDTGVNNGIDSWHALAAAQQRGELLQRVLLMGGETLSGIADQQTERLRLGPLKIYLRESQLPDLDGLVGRIVDVHRHQRAVAVHCVTLVELHVALAAIAQAGVLPGDRIEHASIADDYTIERIAELGITVVTQPHFIFERGDRYLLDVDAADRPLLYRCAGFLQRGALLAAGSDAPYGAIDPWAAMRAAVDRKTRQGQGVGSSESLTPRQALQLFAGTPAQPASGWQPLRVGDHADVCLLDAPLERVLQDLDARHVLMTLCGGIPTFTRKSVAT